MSTNATPKTVANATNATCGRSHHADRRVRGAAAPAGSGGGVSDEGAGAIRGERVPCAHAPDCCASHRRRRVPPVSDRNGRRASALVVIPAYNEEAALPATL